MNRLFGYFIKHCLLLKCLAICCYFNFAELWVKSVNLIFSVCPTGDSLKNQVKTIRQPIVAGTSDLDEVEVTMPNGLYTPKGRRAMFKKYSDQVLKAQGSGVNEETESKFYVVKYLNVNLSVHTV